MRRYITIMAIYVVGIFGGMAAINYTVDPAHIYHNDYVDTVIDGLAQGKCVTNIDNMDERIFKQRLIELHRGEHFDYIIMGASAQALLSSQMFGGAKTLNIQAGGAMLEDKAAIYQMLRDNNVTADTYIFGIALGDFHPHDGNEKWKSIANYYYKFMGEEPPLLMINSGKLSNLVSTTYFAYSIRTFVWSYTRGENPVRYVDTDLNDGMTLRPDGSITWPKATRERPLWQVIYDVDKAWEKDRAASFAYTNMAERKTRIFEKLMGQMIADSCHIAICASPFIPWLGEKKKNIEGNKQAEAYIRNFAKTHNMEIIGDFYAENAGLTNSDFHDGTHPKAEALNSLINAWLDSKKEEE